MPSIGRVQLNLSVEPEIKESLRKHCEAAGVSFAQAISEYVKACDHEGHLIISPITNPIPNSSIELDEFITREQLNEILTNEYSTNTIPSTNLVTKKELATEISKLREELLEKLEIAEKQYDKLATITKIDKKSLEPIFEPYENELEDMEKPSQLLTPVEKGETSNEVNNEQWLKARQFAQQHGFSESAIRVKTSKTRAKLRKNDVDTKVVTFFYEGKTIEARQEGRTTLYKLLE